MRKLPSIALVLGTILIAGCGGGGGGGDAASPLDEALRYLPADAPFAVAIDTDTDGEQFQAAGEIVDRFPFGDQVAKQLEGLVEDRGADLERIQKALGNEFVVGSTDAQSFVESPGGSDTSFVGAIQAADQSALDDLLEQDKAEEVGEANGAKLYEDDSGDAFAVEGDVLVVAGSRQELEAALETHDGDDGLTEDEFEAALEDVPDDALLRVYVDIEGLLQTSEAAAPALRSKWVRALRTAGIGLSFESGEVAIDFGVNTDSEGLTDADLPIAPGGDAPEVLAREGEIGAGLRNPAHVLEFAQATARAVDPDGYRNFDNGLRQIEQQVGIDLQKDFLDQIEGDLAVSVGLDGKFGARAELKDPATFERTLGKVADVLAQIFEDASGGGFTKPKAGGSFYVLESPDLNVAFGVADGRFVVASDATTAGSLTGAKQKAVPGAEGALVVGTDAEQLARTILGSIDDFDIAGEIQERLQGQIGRQLQGELGRQLGGQLGRRLQGGLGGDLINRVGGAIVTRPLDELTASVESSTEGLTGSVTLTLDEPR